MTLTATTDGAKATFAISGWLNAATAPELAKALEELNNDITELVMDFAELDYLSSAGMRQLVAASRKTHGHLTIINASADVKAILELSGFSRLGHIV